MCSPSYQTPPDANSIHTYNSLILKLLTIYMDIFCMIRVKKNAIMTNKQIKEPKIERETERNEISGPGFFSLLFLGKPFCRRARTGDQGFKLVWPYIHT